MIVYRGLLVSGLILTVVLVAFVVAVVIRVITELRKEVPMKVGSLVMCNRFANACSGVGMGKANPLEEKRRNHQ